jgi:hypothetical protein
LDIAFEVEGRRVNASASVRGDLISIVGAEKRTSPEAQIAFASQLERLAMEKTSPVRGLVGFRVGRYDEKRERTAWLKAALLVAFAAWGYRYALRPILNAVRAQIANPDSALLANAAFKDPVSGSRGTRQLVIVREPADLRSVLVAMDEWHVLLPDFAPAPDFYDRLFAALAQRGGGISYSGDLCVWPDEPVYALDYLMAGQPLK